MRAAAGIVRRGVRPLALGAFVLLQACATGHYSHIAESDAGQRADEAERDKLLAESGASPDVLMVGGNALLPGGRGVAGLESSATGAAGASPLLAPTVVGGAMPLVALGGATRGGPLTGLAGGASAAAPFGVGAVPATLAASALRGVSTVGGAVGGVAASAASSALLVDLSGVAAKGSAGLLGPATGATTRPPVATVPGAVPLTGAVKTILTIPSGVLGH
jgi:hypothetical protein